MSVEKSGEVKCLQQLHRSPETPSPTSSTSSSSSSSLPISVPFTRQTSDPGTGTPTYQQQTPPQSSSLPGIHRRDSSHDSTLVARQRQASDAGGGAPRYQQQTPPQSSSLPGILEHRGRDSASVLVAQQQQASLMSATETAPVAVCTASSPNHSLSDLPELISTSLNHTRPLILQHPQHGSHVVGSGEDGGNGTYINWLYDFYPSVMGSPKDKLPFPDQQSSPVTAHSTLGKVDFSREAATNTVFRSQEKYVVTLGAPISIAQRMGEDTLTYLNKGQFYTMYMKANTNLSVPERVKTVIYLTFFDEPDKRVEFNHWQYWYNLQANPNQKAFDIDRKNCENVQTKPEDMAYNAAGFVWYPELGAKIVLRINCLSTEFTSQKGVKGIPLHMVADTYEDFDNEEAEPVHRGSCRIKIFRDKGAERKNKDETKSAERRMQKFMKQQPGVDSEPGSSPSVFHPPSKETLLNSTSTFGPRPYLFVPQQDSTGLALTPSKAAATTLLANIRERETKRTFSTTLSQTKEDLDHLEVQAPAKKAARIPDKPLTTVYVRKEEEKVYNALLLDSLTVHDFKLQISKKYDVPPDMIKNTFKKTRRGLLVHFDDEMISHFQEEDDFIIDLIFDNQKGCFDLVLQY